MRKGAIFIWLALLGLLFFSTQLFTGNSDKVESVAISVFIDRVENDQVKEVVIEGGNVIGTLSEGKLMRSFTSDREELIKALREHDVKYAEKPPSNSDQWIYILMKLALPIILILFFFRMMKGAAGQQMRGINDHSSHKANLIQEKEVKTRFSDVAGVDEAVDEVKETVDFLRNPQKYTVLGGKIPKGTLLMGPSGTGKTLLARAIAGEAGVPFFAASGGGFVEMFVGVGASRVRSLFETAKKHAPCVIFIDELDAVGKKRGGVTSGGGHDEREQTLNELLVQMDGFEAHDGVMLVAATNRPDVLDSALIRPGRFDRRVVVPPPDLNGRQAILKVHARDKKLADDVDLAVVARGTPGMTGADLENLLNEAALMSGRHGKSVIDAESIEEALDKVLMGPARKGMVMNEHDKRVVAYHECGHALVAWFNPYSDPVHKVTMIPRGQALGLTFLHPLDDRHLYSRSELLAKIEVAFGGRVIEALKFEDVTTGAGNDIERATELAHMMVTRVAMTDGLGLRSFSRQDEGFFIPEKNYSEATAARIDEEIEKLLDECHERVEACLKKHMAKLESLVSELLEKETLVADEVEKILGPRPKR